MSSWPHLGDQRLDRHASERFADPLARFAIHLKRRGHSAGTAHAYRNAVSHFLSWQQTLPVGRHGPVSPELVRCFLDEHLPVCACPGRIVHSRQTLRAALNQFLLMNGQPHLSPPSASVPAAIADAVEEFDSYLKNICALAEQTRRTRCRLMIQFLIRVFGSGPIQFDQFTPALLIDSITTCSADAPTSTPSLLVGALRSYLRFLCFQGIVREDLSSGLPTPARWPLTAVPPALSQSELPRFWSAFDRSTATGQRDDAMAHCLADLGLRCQEVAELTLESLDWRAGVLTLSRTKSRRRDQLPLPSATGEAIATYLRQWRPRCSTRALFVHHRAPVGAPVAKTTVRGAIRRAFQRAGLPWSGTHVLRHTAARRMLEGGCSLKEIADVLRHRSIDTTAIYAKVDLPHLIDVALPWPEVRP